jgi:hypothetical protein
MGKQRRAAAARAASHPHPLIICLSTQPFTFIKNLINPPPAEDK